MKTLSLVTAFTTIVLCLPAVVSVGPPKVDFAQACYGEPLPVLVPSRDNRTIPWGTMGVINGTSCCSSLDQVRAGIDEIDAQLLELLSQRAAYVREATRFKATRDVVDVPARDEQVIDGAVSSAPGLHLPVTVARAVFTAILNASVSFELCIFDSFHGRGYQDSEGKRAASVLSVGPRLNFFY